MKLLTFTLVLSLMALASGTAQELDWNTVIKCTKVGTKIAAQLVRHAIPELRTYLTCIDYNPPPNPKNCFLAYVKIAYEMLRRSVDGKLSCLVDPLKRGVAYLQPNIADVDKFKCLPF